MRQEFRLGNTTDSDKWVINLSNGPLSTDERAILEKGPKFALTPSLIPHKNIVAEIEAAINDLPDESKDAIRTTAANILRRSDPPKHKNTTAAEHKALEGLKKDKTRVVMEADKGNCFVVMDKKEYDEKMQVLLADPNIYNKVTKPPFKGIERELNSLLLEFKRQQKLDERTYKKLHSTDGIPPLFAGQLNITNRTIHCALL